MLAIFHCISLILPLNLIISLSISLNYRSGKQEHLETNIMAKNASENPIYGRPIKSRFKLLENDNFTLDHFIK